MSILSIFTKVKSQQIDQAKELCWFNGSILHVYIYIYICIVSGNWKKNCVLTTNAAHVTYGLLTFVMNENVNMFILKY